MTGNSQQRFGSNRAYGYDNNDKHGIIQNIQDPANRGRVQVKFFGYNDPNGVPKEMVEWLHVAQEHSQIAGHTSTQPYYAGSTVKLEASGGEHYVSGGAPGFDSEKRLQTPDPAGVDDSNNDKPDQPNIVRGDQQTSIRSSPGLQPDSSYGANQYFAYSNWSGMFKTMYPYALGTGSSGGPAPFGQGTKAKLASLKTLGTQKLQNGSDILDTITSMDNNFSGAFQPAVQIIKNLRNNGYGNGIQQMGGSAIGQSEGIFNGVFGTPNTGLPSNAVIQDLISLILALIAAYQFVNSLTASNLYSNTSSFNLVYTPLTNSILAVSSDLVLNIETDVNNIILAGGTLPLPYYATVLADIDNNFNQAMSQASTNLLIYLNNLTASANTLGQVVYILGGNQLCSNLAIDLNQYDNMAGVSNTVTYSTCQGVIGLALQGKLNSIPLYRPANTAPAQSSDNPSNPASISKWTGNSIAMGELQSGTINTNFLTGIKKLYQQVMRNHGDQAKGGPLKQHPARLPSYSDGASMPLNYTDSSLGSQLNTWLDGSGYNA